MYKCFQAYLADSRTSKLFTLYFFYMVSKLVKKSLSSSNSYGEKVERIFSFLEGLGKSLE